MGEGEDLVCAWSVRAWERGSMGEGEHGKRPSMGEGAHGRMGEGAFNYLGCNIC